jgi:cupin fold WbuC family metalloprotein
MSPIAFTNFMRPKSTTFFNTESAVELSAGDLTRLKGAALADPVGRARLCLHLDHESLVHQMLIAFTDWSYVRPHRHPRKTESFHAIEGEFDLIFLEDSGEIDRRLRMGPIETGLPFVHRLAGGSWHMLIPRSNLVVIHEISSGPFEPSDNEYPEWAPDESDREAARAFMAALA